VWCTVLNIPLSATFSFFWGARGAAAALVTVAALMTLSLAWRVGRRPAIWRAAFKAT